MLSPNELKQMQREQHIHDLRNHFDILSRHKTDRIKHYALHYAKYVGRLAREAEETKPVTRTIIDAFLINLSASNTLCQDLSKETFIKPRGRHQVDRLKTLADAVGRFADACEKIDHLEEFVPQARAANRDITFWLLMNAIELDLNVVSCLSERRQELATRQFYIAD